MSKKNPYDSAGQTRLVTPEDVKVGTVLRRVEERIPDSAGGHDCHDVFPDGVIFGVEKDYCIYVAFPECVLPMKHGKPNMPYMRLREDMISLEELFDGQHYRVVLDAKGKVCHRRV